MKKINSDLDRKAEETEKMRSEISAKDREIVECGNPDAEIAELRSRIGELDERHRLMGKTIEFLQKAKEALENKYQPRIEKSLKDYIDNFNSIIAEGGTGRIGNTQIGSDGVFDIRLEHRNGMRELGAFSRGWPYFCTGPMPYFLTNSLTPVVTS